ncbi:MAG TPA: translation initiation factor IF-2 associated domain-containing protein, partial [Arenimonas sp.]|nr:translation initiation factor IF-2 associated domain-containing protein [Arenimonas sp.]
MSEVTVGSLAKVLGMPTEKLLEQLAGAGMTFSGPDQVVSSTEKMKLLGFLRRTHGKDEKAAEGEAPKQITLKRRKVEELTVSAGKAKTTVSIEVRQKRTYVKRDQVETPQNDEREDALRKLEESKSRNQAENDALNAQDRARREEEAQRRAVIEAAAQAARAEAEKVVAAVVVKPDEDAGAKAPKPVDKHAPRPHKVDIPLCCDAGAASPCRAAGQL